MVHMCRTPWRSDMAKRQRDVNKERYWAKVIREAARSGTSIREYRTKGRTTAFFEAAMS